MPRPQYVFGTKSQKVNPLRKLKLQYYSVIYEEEHHLPMSPKPTLKNVIAISLYGQRQMKRTISIILKKTKVGIW